MKAEEIIKNLNLENLENYPSPDAEETIRKKLTLPNLKNPDTTPQNRTFHGLHDLHAHKSPLDTLLLKHLSKTRRMPNSAHPSKKEEKNPHRPPLPLLQLPHAQPGNKWKKPQSSTAQTMDA
jgi:hypothetical protein